MIDLEQRVVGCGRRPNKVSSFFRFRYVSIKTFHQFHFRTFISNYRHNTSIVNAVILIQVYLPWYTYHIMIDLYSL
jgi:hypothetical protein